MVLLNRTQALMLMDLLATNDWNRPIYWATTIPVSKYFNLQKYFKVDGLAYQLVPVVAEKTGPFYGEIDSDVMFDNVMNKFRWGGIEKDKKLYFDENNIRMFSNLRNNFVRLAEKLIQEGKIDSALQVLDRCMDLFPQHKIPFNNTMLPVISAYYHAQSIDKANNLLTILQNKVCAELDYYISLPPELLRNEKHITNELQINMFVLQELYRISAKQKQFKISKDIEKQFMRYVKHLNG